MLCLSYIRIIELELNHFLITPIRSIADELCSIYSEEYDKITSNQKKKDFSYKWQCLKDIQRGEHGIVLGSMWYLFTNISTKRSEDAVSFRIMELLKTIVNENGFIALRNGRLADLICSDVRERFRNPPAHTKYVHKETALECKEYVERTIWELHSYLR